MRVYNRTKQLKPIAPPSLVELPMITESTKLVSVEVARQKLFEDKGLKWTAETVRAYCRTGRWYEKYHFVRYGNQYLINLEAVYWSIANGI